MQKQSILVGLLIFYSSVIRFAYLTFFPPGGIGSWWLRAPSAFAGVISIVLLFFIVRALTQNFTLAYLSAVALSLMPWHIEQSRILSPVMVGLAILLTGLFLLTVFKQLWQRVFIILTTLILFRLASPSLWFFKNSNKLPIFQTFLSNTFKLLSFEFLFYHNDAFWAGGLRRVGVFLPFTSIIFIIGLFKVFTLFNKRVLVHLLFASLILFAAALNPLFPEELEFFLITPYLAVIVGLGLIELVTFVRKKTFLSLSFGLMFLLLVTYEYVVFFHYYTLHYTNRIKNEIPYATRTF